VIVVRAQHMYLALANGDAQRATIVDAPPATVDSQAGIWVASGGAASAGKTAMALLVPDGVDNVDVIDERGALAASIPVVDNIAFVERDGAFTAEYRFGSDRHRATAPPAMSGGLAMP